jgi:phosphoribosylglycinamide formyltransferase-1
VPARLVVLVSGEGTTLQAILDACRDPGYGASVVAVITDREGTGAADRARRAGLRAQVVALADHPDRAAWDRALAATVQRYRPDLVVCAGFMKLLGPAVLSALPGRIVNTHPSLLPRHPGAHAVRDTLAAGDEVSGATVIYVDEGVDTGPVISSVTVPVLPGDDETALHARIKAAEAPLFVETIHRLTQELP